MRTTITIDDDLMLALKKRSVEKGLTLKEMINRTLRSGFQVEDRAEPAERYECPEYSMGKSYFNLDKALSVADSLENEELIRKVRLKK